MDAEETRIYTAVLITCLLVGSIFFFLFISMYRQFRNVSVLQKQFSSAEINAIEKERSRLAADLHDELAPLITFTGISLSQLQLTAEEDLTRRTQLLQTNNETLHRLREISFDLMPASLLRQGLIGGIEQLVSKLKSIHHIRIGIVAESNIHLPPQHIIHLFRITQEVLHNTIRHANASQVLIVLEKRDNLLILKIADDGKGMNYARVLKSTKGFGLRSIRNRVSLMNAKVFISSLPGQGLSYVIEIPMNGKS